MSDTPNPTAGQSDPAEPAPTVTVAETVKSLAQDEQPPAAPKKLPLNFNVQYEYSGPPLLKFDPTKPYVPYPSATRLGSAQAVDKTQQLLNNTRQINAQQLDHASVFNESLGQLPLGGDMYEMAAREANYAQSIKSEVGELQGNVPKFKPSTGSVLAGELAKQQVRSALKMGSLFSFPLWHSGFWMTVRSPSESQLLELYRQLMQDKTALGRATYGIVFSQASVYVAKIMMDFVQENLYSMSLTLPEGESLLKHIRAQDYQVILWGLTCATWPNGYQMRRSCISDLEECNHVTTAVVNPARLLWQDKDSLSAKQIQHMSKRGKNSVTLEQVAEYVAEFQRGHNRLVELDASLGVTLTMPTLETFINRGFEWIGTLEEQYGRVVGMSESERNGYLLQQAQSQSMRQYSQYVHSLQLITEEGAETRTSEIVDEETILDTLNELSAHEEVREKFISAVSQFQSQGSMCFPAIPNYKCPACGGWQNPTSQPGHDHELIPLDIAQSFFLLLMQKLKAIQVR